MSNNKIQVKDDTKKETRKEWDNPIEFLMTCVGFAVGLGNVWRFPYLCFKNGGSAFVLAFSVMLFIIGLPLFYLEITLSQFSKYGPLGVWKVVPALRGLGFCSLFLSTFIAFYYNTLLCYSVIYTISSFMPTLPWTTCDSSWNNAKCCITTLGQNISCAHDSESPAKQYFNNYVLDMSDGIGEVGYISWKLALSLLVCWLLIFASLSKGVASLGKVSYVTAIFPYIMLVALIIRGITLPGAMKGIEYYILKLNYTALYKLQTWVDAMNQVYFCLGISQGSLYTLGRHNKFHYNHERTAIFIAVLDGFTGILAGFAIFSVLGYMSDRTGIPVQDLAVGGPGLTFIVYPEALSLMPFPWIWCIMFFLMMITIGFGSILSYMECCLDSLSEILKKWEKTACLVNNKRKELLFRLCVCLTLFTISLFTLSTRNGIYVENLLDNYVTGYPILICATLEVIGIGWIYGMKRLKKDLKLMRGSYPNLYWIICFTLLTPIFTSLGIVLSIIANTEIVLNDYHYPQWAHYIGWSIVTLILSPILIIFVQTAISTKFDLKKMFNPASDWLPAIPLSSDDMMASETNDSENDSSDDSSKGTNLEMVANSNMILLSGSKKNKESHAFMHTFSMHPKKKKQLKTTEI